MNGLEIVRIGSPSTHGGVVITGQAGYHVNGIPISRIGDLHSCPIPGHGITPIITGSQISTIQGITMAYVTSIAACGAMIIAGASIGSTI